MAEAAAKIHVADVGTAFRTTMLDEAGAVIDVAAANLLKMWFEKPDKSTVEYTAAKVTDGTDGRIQYVTASASDLDQPGGWKAQGVVGFPDGRLHHGDVHKFKVHANLRPG